MQRNILVDIKSSGQPRPYADSRTIATITFTYKSQLKANKESPEPEWKPSAIRAEDVMKFVMVWFDVPQEPKSDFSPRITHLKETSQGVWEVEIVTLYNG